MMTDFVFNDKEFTLAKDRYNSLVAKWPKYSFVDKGLRDAIKQINADPDTATLFSCASHPEKQEYEGYIYFATNVIGLQKVMAISKECCNNDTSYLFNFRLEYATAYNFLDETTTSEDLNAWILRFNVKSNRQKTKCLKIIKAAIQQVLYK